VVEIVKEINGKYSFRAKSKSGGLLLRSIDFIDENEINQTLSELNQKGLFSFERKTKTSGKFQFNLKDANGRVIGYSNLYTSEAGMENGIKNLTKSISAIK